MFSSLFESMKKSQFRSPFSTVQCDISGNPVSGPPTQPTQIIHTAHLRNPVKGRIIEAANGEDSCEFGSAKYFGLCSIGGILSCGTTHLLVVPLDLVKCRLQVDPGKYKNLVNGFQVTVAEEGVRGLAKGWAPTLFGYSAQVSINLFFYKLL